MLRPYNSPKNKYNEQNICYNTHTLTSIPSWPEDSTLATHSLFVLPKPIQDGNVKMIGNVNDNTEGRKVGYLTSSGWYEYYYGGFYVHSNLCVMNLYGNNDFQRKYKTSLVMPFCEQNSYYMLTHFNASNSFRHIGLSKTVAYRSS